MKPHRVSGSNAYGWSSNWDRLDEDHPLAGEKFYDLPGGVRIYPGDHFWDSENRYVLKVNDVKTKFYRGVVGADGEDAGDYVFFERDWSPPIDPQGRRRRVDDTFYIRVEEFSANVHDGRLVPHRGNGRRLPP